jgi:hypothetical protein
LPFEARRVLAEALQTQKKAPRNARGLGLGLQRGRNTPREIKPLAWPPVPHLRLAFRPTLFRHACKMGLEGIVSKRKGSPYRSGRSPDWLKMKNPNAHKRQSHRHQ